MNWKAAILSVAMQTLGPTCHPREHCLRCCVNSKKSKRLVLVSLVSHCADLIFFSTICYICKGGGGQADNLKLS